MRSTRALVVLTVVVGAFFALANSAFASPAASTAMGYCGPGADSKSAMTQYYVSNATAGKSVDQYVRAYSSYYHIQSDQSLASWLSNPHVKFFAAPQGYRIKSNTYCTPNGAIAPYNGHYDVGGVKMLWWCSDTRGYGCTPIAKGYCRNMVTGNMIRPVPKLSPAHHVKVTPKAPAHKPKPKVVSKPAPKPQLPVVKCGEGLQIGNVGGQLACVPQVISQSSTQTASQSSDTTQKQGATTSGSGSPATQLNVSVSPQITVQTSSQSASQSSSNSNAGQTQSMSTTPCTTSCTTTTTSTPPASCVTITSIIDLNDVPEGKTSGQMSFTVNSCGSGSATVDGGNGGVSKCDSNVKQSSVTYDLTTGNNSLCVIYYAPGEASVNAGSITYTAINGSAKDVKVDTFAITHPVRQ